MPKSINILVVDDIPMHSAILKIILKKYSEKIDYAQSGAEAVDKFKKNKYDIIFMDYMMPGMTGSDTTREIRKIESENSKTIPIIATTCIDKDKAPELFDAGMTDYLPKPIKNAAVELILDKYSLRNKKTHNSETNTWDFLNDAITNQKSFNDFLNMSTDKTNTVDLGIKQIKKRVQDLTDSYKKEDISKHIPSLKSMFSSLGMEYLSKIAEEIETKNSNGSDSSSEFDCIVNETKKWKKK